MIAVQLDPARAVIRSFTAPPNGYVWRICSAQPWIRGHCAYYGLTGNGKRLGWFRYQVVRIWRKWLARRSRLMCPNWDRMAEILKRLPLPSVTFTRSCQNTLSEPVR